MSAPKRVLTGAGCLLVGVLVAIDLGPTTTSRGVNQIRGSAERGVPTLAPRAAPPGASVWVPDRWLPYRGEPGGVFVPGHWELPVGDGRVLAPPTAIEQRQTGTITTLPGSVHAPDEPRQAP